MPKIVINEQEDTSLATFDVTENTVLVPMLYARDYEGTYGEEGFSYKDAIDSTLFTSAKAFKTKLAGRYIYTDEARTLPDKSYVMAYELLLQGLNVVIKPITFDNAAYSDSNKKAYVKESLVQNILEEAIVTNSGLSEFKDKNIFNIKFITSGAYPNIGLVPYNNGSKEVEDHKSSMHTTLAELAEIRGDAVAMVEFAKDLANDSKEDLLAELKNYSANNSYDKFSNAMFPWCNFTTSVMNVETEFVMPAGFAYLMAYANSVKSNANWFAAGGVIRGAIPNMLTPLYNVGEDLMHILQGDQGNLTLAINPIYKAGTYDYRIWGNRVMNKNSDVSASMYSNYLNVRILLCDIKKQIFHAAMRTTFEPNDDIVWINFKTLANSLLDKMKSGRGIKWYSWTKEKADEKATIKATLAIQPIEAVDSFVVNVLLTDDETSIEEEQGGSK